MRASREIGIDHLTMLDVSPPELVSVAHEAGFDAVSPRVLASTPEEEPWPMSPGSPMLEETARRLEETGVRALSVEVVRIGPGTTREDYEAALEAGARLGARYVTVNSDDPDLDRTSETFAALVADARPYGLRPVIEPIPYTRVSNLEEAVYVAERSGGGGVLLDALHFRRYGGRIEALLSLDPALLSYVQLCDAPLEPPSGLMRPRRLPRGQSTDGTDLQLESRAMRLLPGDGELPLAELLAALPKEMAVSVEAPVLSLLNTMPPVEFARRARRAVENVLHRAQSA
ncbi:Xylose isomerase-like TIM barrel [Rubrobacter xylanophilus DSM 9941]|uniref:Xylose isomerase-like TIM barrel n=1 Tax=Rubrobacter xylanophilus (strain DSM 9941 / JCM 11954 / NBRC 16129 / PRD-1) TaxID=266117 RepID=Q1AVM6_RUBXD|nr:TIM barrel protein [Rubrobacter xylanophilus]ABG04552.1 Xylose isomerase-like TIM barrel [Rubrobacter xylanophilus DSM 9941]